MLYDASVKMWSFIVNELLFVAFRPVALRIILFSHMARKFIIEVSTYRTSVR